MSEDSSITSSKRVLTDSREESQFEEARKCFHNVPNCDNVADQDQFLRRGLEHLATGLTELQQGIKQIQGTLNLPKQKALITEVGKDYSMTIKKGDTASEKGDLSVENGDTAD